MPIGELRFLPVLRAVKLFFVSFNTLCSDGSSVF